MTGRQTWRLVCLRRYPTKHWLSELHRLTIRRFVHDIHPLDADSLVESVVGISPFTFYTLSTVLIDRMVFSAWKVGVETLSEILLSRGLWR